MREVLVVAATRTAIGRARTGSLRDTQPEDLLAAVIAEVCGRTAGLNKKDVDDVVIGSGALSGGPGVNIARAAALYAGMPDTVPGHTVSRACSSGLQAIVIGAQSIMCGFADVVIAGGVGSASLLQTSSEDLKPHPAIVGSRPEVYTPMNIAAENIARRYDMTRGQMDEFAFSSHRKALKAMQDGKFKREIAAVKTRVYPLDPTDRSAPEEVMFGTDEYPDPDVDMENLAALHPAFDPAGLVTGGNSAQPGDGAAGVMLTSREKAQKLGIKPVAALRWYAAAGVPPDVAGIGLTAAVPKLLRVSGMQLKDFGLVQIDETFASQAIHCIRELGLNEETVNVNGGDIALGHPLACTGAALAVTILHEMQRRKARHSLVATSAEGGMGVAAAFEREISCT